MENVVAFNNELSGLYESKPPISKAKMAAITKAAMRAIKFYKHVVQSVEKFILKCKPEYKVPGLYVIDSIVRQSRHQFGIEKDVFAPRFARNIKDTFSNLFRCAPEDKSRIIRVLNLWQKNNVFAPDVIQPLFDFADPNHPIYQMQPNAAMQDISMASNGGLNTSGGSADMMGNPNASAAVDDKLAAVPDLSTNNLTQLLKDPNVLRQLQTLQNLQKFKQQEEKQHKLNEMRLQEEKFEKHIQNVLKGQSTLEPSEMSGKDLEFAPDDGKIEVINLDGNDSRSPSMDRYNKRRRSRSPSRNRDRGGRDLGRDRDRRRRSRSRSRSRSPRSNRRRTSREREREPRDRERNKEKDKEKDREYERERRRKGLPDIKKEHLSVCSTTLWVGHLSKLVYQEELSDTFGKYGDIVSIDMIVPRGCAFIVMHRRQDAHKAMISLKNHKLQNRAITISWAAGKGVKSKEWKDFWDLELGVTYIPWNKISEDTDFDSLEEGGMYDEDSMPTWMKEKINQAKVVQDKAQQPAAGMFAGLDGLPAIDTSKPPPQPGALIPGVPPMVPPQFPMARMMGPMGVPIPGNLMAMPPNMVGGMPPHMMLPPGFPQMPPVDKSVPPPGIGGHPDGPMTPSPFMGNPPLIAGMPPPMGIPPPQFQPPPAPNPNMDDQMDIEMDDENSPGNVPGAPPHPINFNQPPPLFASGFPGNEGGGRREDFGGGRERNRGERGERSRWGGRNEREVSQSRDRGNRDGMAMDVVGPEQAGNLPPALWRENGVNFPGGGPGGNGPMNIPPLDLQHGPPRGDFFGRPGGDDFNDERRGGGGPRGDFFPNMGGNRFGQPGGGGGMQMRGGHQFSGPRMGGGPPSIFGPRGANPGQGPRSGQRFNPFDREDRGGRMRGDSDRRGGRDGGRGNWRDDDDGNIFQRRGGGRFQNRDDDDRRSRDRDRGDRSGGRDTKSRERRDSDRQSNSRHRSDSAPRDGDNDRTRSTTDQEPEIKSVQMEDIGEEDWDDELPEHDIQSAPSASGHAQDSSEGNFDEPSEKNAQDETFVAPAPPQREEQSNFASTPLYDEPIDSNSGGFQSASDSGDTAPNPDNDSISRESQEPAGNAENSQSGDSGGGGDESNNEKETE